MFKKWGTGRFAIESVFSKEGRITCAPCIYKKIMNRSRCSRMFFKVNVLKNFAIFSGKHLCKSHFFIKVQT